MSNVRGGRVSRGSLGLRGGVSRARGHVNPTPATEAGSAAEPAASVSQTQASLTLTLPVSISLSAIKQFQAFLRQHAWIAVKSMASMRVGQQKKVSVHPCHALS
jgi:hypothetical protein